MRRVLPCPIEGRIDRIKTAVRLEDGAWSTFRAMCAGTNINFRLFVHQLMFPFFLYAHIFAPRDVLFFSLFQNFHSRCTGAQQQTLNYADISVNQLSEETANERPNFSMLSRYVRMEC